MGDYNDLSGRKLMSPANADTENKAAMTHAATQLTIFMTGPVIVVRNRKLRANGPLLQMFQVIVEQHAVWLANTTLRPTMPAIECKRI